jgi:ligand-binding sensor domain-containing protein
MKTLTRSLAGVAAITAVMGLAGCSKNHNSDESLAQTDPAMDSLISQVVSRQEALQSRRILIDRTGTQDVNGLSSVVTDITVADSTVYATHQGGLVLFNLNKDSLRTLTTTQPLHAVVKHEGTVYIGGDRLYQLQDSAMVPDTEDFGGIITVLYSYGPALMIGTENGLYARTVTGTMELMRDIWVTSLTSDGNGLWVGTDGDGLYRWDGQRFSKRFLSRDSSLFDYVNCLSFKRDRLYVGTTGGLFVYNGGKWQPYTTADGLPSDNVLSVATAGWTTFIGTDQGVVKLADTTFLPVKHLESMTTTVLKSSPSGLLVGTETEGLLLKQGDAIKVLAVTKAAADVAMLSLGD